MSRTLKAPILKTGEDTTIRKSLTDNISDKLTRLAVITLAAAMLSGGLSACGSDETPPNPTEVSFAQSIEQPNSMPLYSEDDCKIMQANNLGECKPLNELGTIDNQLASSAAPTSSTTTTHSSGGGNNALLWYMIGRMNSTPSAASMNYPTSSFSAPRPAAFLNMDRGNASISPTAKFTPQNATQNAAVNYFGGPAKSVQAVKSGTTSNITSRAASYNASRSSAHAPSSGGSRFGGFGHSGGHSSGG